MASMRIMERGAKIYSGMEGIPFWVKMKTMLLIPISMLCYLIPDRYYLVNYIGGKIYLRLAEYPTMFARKFGVYEYLKSSFFRSFLRKGMTVVDIGASKGFFTLLSARLVGKEGRVISVEPEPTNVKWLRKSIKENGYGCVKSLQLAMSDRNGHAKLFVGKKTGWNSLYRSETTNEDTVDVETRTLDSLVKDARAKHVDLIKIDTEGAEEFVLKGAEKTLRGNRDVVVIIELHEGIRRDKLFGFLEGLGFGIHRLTMDGLAEIPADRKRHITEIVAARNPSAVNDGLRRI